MRAADWNPAPRSGTVLGALKRSVLQGLQSTYAATGLASVYVRTRGIRGATILMYHSVASKPDADWVDPRYHVTPAQFEEQMAFLARRRRVVSLAELVTSLEEGRDLPAGSVVITFDDGYRDNLTEAAPILAKYELPATLFLATAYVSRAENQWIDRLYGLFRARVGQELRFEEDPSARFDLSDPVQERSAYRAASKILLEGTLDRRNRCLQEMESRLKPEAPAPRLTLSWDEVRDLVRRFPRFEIGAHSQNHVDLPGHEGDLAESEIAGCTEEIRRELDRRPDYFSFPYNRWSPQSQERVRRNGYRAAVGSGNDYLITAKSDRYALPRFDSGMPLRRLDFVTSGACPGMVRQA